MLEESMISVRPLIAEDAESICNVHRRAILNLPDIDENILQDWAQNRTPDGYLRNQAKGENFLVALIKDQPVGFISWKQGELLGLFVAPDQQGNGIGSILVATADMAALLANEPIKRVRSRPTARSFYEKHNFHFVSESTFNVAGHTLANIYMER